MTATARSVHELEAMIGAKRKALADIFDGAKIDGEYKLSADQVADIRQRNDELKALGADLEELKAAEEIRRSIPDPDAGKGARAQAGDPGAPASKGAPRVRQIEEILNESKGYQAFRAGAVKTVEFHLTEAEAKTLLTLADVTPRAERRPDIVPSAQAYRQVSDLFAQGTINSNVYEYYEETTFTNNAAETAEGAAKPESALGFTLRQDTMRKIPTWLPVTSEVLEDNDALLSYIRERLTYMVVRRREGQLLNGDGTAPNLSGITDRTGLQTQAKGTDPVFDAILRGMTKVRVTGDAEPTGIVMHPNDWQDLVLTRTADGIYILGNPSDPTVGQRLWGADVRQTPVQTENTAIVGAFRPMAQIFRKPNSGITITISTEHDTYFVENKVAILAEERLLLAVYRPAAFCTVTGI